MKKSKACRIYKVYFWALVICIYLFLIVWSIIIFRLNGEIHFSDAFDITFFLSVATAIVIYHTRYIIDIQLNNNTIVFSTLGKKKYIIENNFPITLSGRRRTRSLYLYIEGKEYLGVCGHKRSRSACYPKRSQREIRADRRAKADRSDR